MPTHDSPGTRPTADLLDACGRGDEAAFAELYDATSSRVHGLAQRILCDPAQAEAATHEAYLAVWQDARLFDPSRGSAMAWILALTHRKAVDRVRSTQAARSTADDDRRAEPTPLRPHRDAATDPAQGVLSALQSLSRAHREAVELAYFGGYTHHEVSVLLEIPVGAARSRIRDGLLRLRDHLVRVDRLAT